MAKMTPEEAKVYVAGLMARARAAEKIAEKYTQERVDELVGAIAYEMSREDVKKELAEIALEETELGDIPSKIGKIQKKVKGVYRDIKNKKTVGVCEEYPERGLRRLYKPAGVVGALVPSTQPEMLPICTALFAIKARDAVVFSPHPRGKKTTNLTIAKIRAILKKYDAPEDLLICADEDHINLNVTNEIMAQCDLVVATGGESMVKAAYSSGTPAYGVGAGNDNVVCDDTADLKFAAHTTHVSKIADLAAGCSCDNSLVIFESVYDEMVENLKAEGGYLCNEEEKAKFQKALFPNWPNDKVINRDMVAKPVQTLAKIAGVELPEETEFIMVEETGSGFDYPLSGEKLCLILTLYKAKDLDDAIRIVNANQEYSGAGHGACIYTTNDDNLIKFATETYTSRVNCNLPNSQANTGTWEAGYPFSPSLGCGTWGGNSASENVDLKYYMNNTWVAVPIDGKEPSDEELFGDLKLR